MSRKTLSSRADGNGDATVELLQVMLFTVLDTLGKVQASGRTGRAGIIVFEPPETVNELVPALESELIELSIAHLDTMEMNELLKHDILSYSLQAHTLRADLDKSLKVITELISPSDVSAIDEAFKYAVHSAPHTPHGGEPTYTLTQSQLKIALLDAIEHYNHSVTMKNT